MPTLNHKQGIHGSRPESVQVIEILSTLQKKQALLGPKTPTHADEAPVKGASGDELDLTQ